VRASTPPSAGATGQSGDLSSVLGLGSAELVCSARLDTGTVVARTLGTPGLR